MSYLHSLSVFFSVVEEGSFSAAAKKLNLTQPTVSFHIDNLEKKFGCQLFTRTAKGVSLTIYGEKLQNNTNAFNSILRETENQIKAMVSGSHGEIIIGTSTIPGEYILPGIVGSFLRHNAGIRISIRTGSSSTIMTSFRVGEIPIAIVGIVPESNIPSLPLWRDELVLVASKDLAQTLPDTMKVEEFIQYPFVMRDESSGTTKTICEHLLRSNVNPAKLNTVLKVGGNEALKSAIINGVGIGFVSKRAVCEDLNRNRLSIIATPGFCIERNFYAVHTTPLTPTCLDIFWQYLINFKENQ